MSENKIIKIDMSLLTIGDLYPLINEPEKSLVHSITICNKLIEGGIYDLHPSQLSEILLEFQIELKILLDKIVVNNEQSFVTAFQLALKTWDKN